MTWYYNGTPIDDDSQFPEGTLCFVYCITRIADGKFYIGKKMALFTKTSVKTITRKNGTKAKKKTKTLVPSDWKTYYGSSDELQKDVEQLGVEAFRRDILAFCSNRGTSGYIEMKYQMDARVLELSNEQCYNSIVNARVHKKHIKPTL